MIGHVLELEDLQQLCGKRRLADVERYLTEQGIAFKRRKGGLWTTLEALNAALGVQLPPPNDGAYGVDQVL
jgi:hypothetical protein